MGADLKITFSGASGMKKDIKAASKSKKGSGSAISGSVPLAFKPGGKACTAAASVADVASMGSLELGAATAAPYLVTVAPMTGSISKKGQTINYDVKDLTVGDSAWLVSGATHCTDTHGSHVCTAVAAAPAVARA